MGPRKSYPKRLVRRKGHNEAIVAVAHATLVIVYLPYETQKLAQTTSTFRIGSFRCKVLEKSLYATVDFQPHLKSFTGTCKWRVCVLSTNGLPGIPMTNGERRRARATGGNVQGIVRKSH